MDCEKCYPICKSGCCAYVPFDVEFLKKNLTKFVRPVIRIDPCVGNAAVPVTEDGYCPFLAPDGKCSIYDIRPQLCRDFGTEKDPGLRCGYQAADGRMRSRQERRAIERALDKKVDRLRRYVERHKDRLNQQDAYGGKGMDLTKN